MEMNGKQVKGKIFYKLEWLMVHYN
jgi:hypothetical protein